MADENLLTLAISLTELEQRLESPAEFKDFFMANATQDDDINYREFPFDGEKDVLIQRWINADFNEWFCNVSKWNGAKFNKREIIGAEWVDKVKEALPQETP